MRDRKNQSSKLLGVYADYKSKDINKLKRIMQKAEREERIITETIEEKLERLQEE
jgi:hypothetical protein